MGKRGSVSALPQRQNSEPLAETTGRPCKHSAQRPTGRARLGSSGSDECVDYPPLREALRKSGKAGAGGPGIPVKRPPKERKTIRDAFTIHYGQKELHSKEHLAPGRTLIISSSGADNGCYGFFDFQEVIQPPFVTVPSTGSIGEACVQEFPCGVTDDCLLVISKPRTPGEALYIAAAVLRHERWRFDYGRKMTPARVGRFPLPLDPNLLGWIREALEQARVIEQEAIKRLSAIADDDIDAEIARERLAELRAHPERLITGEALQKRLKRCED